MMTQSAAVKKCLKRFKPRGSTSKIKFKGDGVGLIPVEKPFWTETHAISRCLSLTRVPI
jgi:hypothetical protein